jgi:hypothetical protein
MKAIFDRLTTPNKFPLDELLSKIGSILEFQPSQPVSIFRLGGVGRRIWEFESQLDEGNDVVASFSDLQKLAESPEDCVDELLGSIGPIYLGISDSSFLFVQCENKNEEGTIASHFEFVRDIPEIPPPPTPGLERPSVTEPEE